MLSIPDDIKTLFKTDGIPKLWRITVGLDVIDNSTLVQESVTFTQSCCSSDRFQFGRVERNVLEFTTVGYNTNPQGKLIDAVLRISMDSLSAGQISQIWTDRNLYDGYPYQVGTSWWYEIFMGQYIVAKAPRDHSVMQRREWTCYSPRIRTRTVEAAKLASVGIMSEYTPDARNLINSFFVTTPAQAASKASVIAWASMPQDSGASYIFETYGPNHNPPLQEDRYQVYAQVTYRVGYFDAAGTETPDALFEIQNTPGVYDAYAPYVVSMLASAGITVTEAVVKNAFHDPVNPHISFAGGYPADLRLAVVASDGCAMAGTREFCVYPYTNAANVALCRFPETIVLRLLHNHSQVGSAVTVQPYSGATTLPEIFRWTYTDAETAMPLVFAPTGGTDKAWSITAQAYVFPYTFIDAYDPVEIMQGYLEARGHIFRYRRNHASSYAEMYGSIADLDDSAPVEIGPGEYESAWWDEYDVEAVRYVTTVYHVGENGEGLMNVYVGSGSSVYDMTDNEAMAHYAGSQADVRALLQGSFAANIPKADFTPVEITMPGWPWLEAGDAVELTAADGTVVNSYVLRMTMRGIRHLTAEIESFGGEVIEEV